MTSRRLNRAEIEAIVGKDLRAIKAFERLLADVQANITGPSTLVLNYNADGSIAVPLPVVVTFQLTADAGDNFTSGVSWGVTVLSGTFSGAAPTIGGTGAGILLINSGIASPTVTLGITARVNGKGYPPATLTISRTVAPPDGGGGGGTSSDSTSTFFPITGTSFAPIARDLLITLPAAVTSANLTAPAITLVIDSALPVGVTNIEVKWQRETAPSVWTDVGAVATASPSPEVTDSGFTDGAGLPVYFDNSGSLVCNRTETGMTAATAQKFRMVARISGGNTRDIIPIGTLSVTS